MTKEIPLISSSSLRRKNVTLWIGSKKQRNLDSLPPEIIHVLDYLQSTVGTTLVSTKIWKMPSLSSMNSESWELELGLRNSRKSLNEIDRKSTRLNSSHSQISYAVFCLKKK